MPYFIAFVLFFTVGLLMEAGSRFDAATSTPASRCRQVHVNHAHNIGARTDAFFMAQVQEICGR